MAVCHLEDIVIYSTNEEEDEEQVRKVLERLQEFVFYSTAQQSHFGVSEASFL